MARLIDAEFEEKHYTSMLLTPTPDVTKLDQKNARIVIDALKMAPTVDAVPVVRCWECKHGEYDDAIEDEYCYHCRYDGFSYNKADHFCSDGERKGGDE